MQEIIKQLMSLSWWVSVVIVGVLASLTAAYLKPRTDRIIGYVSGRYRRRNERQAKARAVQIETLRSNRHEQIMFAISINYQRLRAISFMLLGSLFMMLAMVFFFLRVPFIIFNLAYFSGVLVVIIGVWDDMEAVSDREILREARKSPTSESKGTLGSSSNESHAGMSRNTEQEKE